MIIMVQTVIIADNGQTLHEWVSTDHGWKSQTEARKAWRDRPLFEQPDHLIDFSRLNDLNLITEIRFFEIGA